ncbi:MAG: DNA integrity scanning protein DisA nucleotide-binding domain protein [Bacilli bacterium]|nr:DNA integrity scanning protein DisA nucleotide-binding domain protein [Bacilli bacterium]
MPLNLILDAAPFQNLGDPIVLTSFLLCVLLPIGYDVFMFFLFKRPLVWVYTFASELLFILGYLFGLTPVFYLGMGLFLVGTLFFLLCNATEVRAPFANDMKGKILINRKKTKKQGEALFDRDDVYNKVMAAVTWMSKQKMGALITFEKKDSLVEEIKSGTVLNCPVSTELIQTIFYCGTRLHDGAVVIRNDLIVAASVYYKPTTRPLTGKYGSRHRAAIGISEICDAVTIVVSEETGRISLAYKGELNPVTPDTLMATFQEFMAITSDSENN